MADLDAARRFLAGEYESAGLPHIAASILTGTSPLARGVYVAAIAAALAASCAVCAHAEPPRITAGQGGLHA